MTKSQTLWDQGGRDTFLQFLPGTDTYVWHIQLHVPANWVPAAVYDVGHSTLGTLSHSPIDNNQLKFDFTII